LFLELVAVVALMLPFFSKHAIVNGHTFKNTTKIVPVYYSTTLHPHNFIMFCNTKFECCTDRIRKKAVNKAVEGCWCTAAVVRFHPLISWPHSQFQKLLPASQSTMFVWWKTISKITAEFTENYFSQIPHRIISV
jgi:hypothetical protein